MLLIWNGLAAVCMDATAEKRYPSGLFSISLRGCSSVDRVLASEAKGRGFDPRQPHHPPQSPYVARNLEPARLSGEESTTWVLHLDLKEAMCTHLAKRGSQYYFRRKIPPDVLTYALCLNIRSSFLSHASAFFAQPSEMVLDGRPMSGVANSKRELHYRRSRSSKDSTEDPKGLRLANISRNKKGSW